MGDCGTLFPLFCVLRGPKIINSEKKKTHKTKLINVETFQQTTSTTFQQIIHVIEVHISTD